MAGEERRAQRAFAFRAAPAAAGRAARRTAREGIQLNSFSYFEHDADVGIIGRGATLERAFECAAEAMFAVMADPQSRLRESLEVSVSFSEDDIELALVQWLNALLGAARERGAVFRRFALTREGSRWSGRAWGESWREDMERGTEVKGATLTMLSVRQTEGAAWEARCVIDV